MPRRQSRCFRPYYDSLLHRAEAPGEGEIGVSWEWQGTWGVGDGGDVGDEKREREGALPLPSLRTTRLHLKPVRMEAFSEERGIVAERQVQAAGAVFFNPTFLRLRLAKFSLLFPCWFASYYANFMSCVVVGNAA